MTSREFTLFQALTLFYRWMEGLVVTNLCQIEILRLPDLGIYDKSILLQILQKFQRPEISSTEVSLFVDKVRDRVVQGQFLLWSLVRSFNCEELEVRSEVRSLGIHFQQRSVINSINGILFKIILIKVGSFKFSSVG